MGTFIPARLKKAREDAGLTQEVFARSLGLSSEFISLLESGKRAPSLSTLARIADHFNKDASFFLGEKEPAFTVLFRAEALKLSPEARLELERFQGYVEDYLRLEEATGRRLELAPLYSGNLSPERMAAEERRRLGLGDEPIRDIFSLLERNGCRILRRPFPGDAEISGVFIFLEAHGAAFSLINSAQTLCRQVFTAAHEYCHYLKDRHDAPLIDSPDIFYETPPAKGKQGGLGLDRGGRAGKNRPTQTQGRSNVPMNGKPRPGARKSGLAAKEQFAQEFAARFLMPPAKVRELVDKDFGAARRLTYDDVLLIKRYFGTSAQAMLRTLRDLDFLTAAQFADFAALDPVVRECEVFGASAEECAVLGPAESAAGTPRAPMQTPDPSAPAQGPDRKGQIPGPESGVIVSDRYRLLRLFLDS